MAEAPRAVIDTNLLLRHLTEDDPHQTQLVRSLLRRAREGRVALHVPSVVVAELAWVLDSAFGMDNPEIAELLEAILNTPELTVADADLLRVAVSLFRQTRIDFADAWIAAHAKLRGIDRVITFDRHHFARIPALRVESPA